MSNKVKNKTICMPPGYLQRIKQAASILGISESELVRRSVDEYLLKFGFSIRDVEDEYN